MQRKEFWFYVSVFPVHFNKLHNTFRIVKRNHKARPQTSEKVSSDQT